jgi:uncharacterized protein YaiE (UPF0345 family)
MSRTVLDPATRVAIVFPPSAPNAGAGFNAVVNSLALVGGAAYLKTGPNSTDWAQFAAGAGFLPLSGGSLNAGASLTVPGTVTAGAASVTGALTAASVTATSTVRAQVNVQADANFIFGNTSAYFFHSVSQGAINWLTAGGAALPMKMGTLVVSDAYSDTAPTNGIFSKGAISAAGGVVSGGNYSLGSRTLAAASGGTPPTYHMFYEPSGLVALYLGTTTDPANYYDNNAHIFRGRGGSTAVTGLVVQTGTNATWKNNLLSQTLAWDGVTSYPFYGSQGSGGTDGIAFLARPHLPNYSGHGAKVRMAGAPSDATHYWDMGIAATTNDQWEVGRDGASRFIVNPSGYAYAYRWVMLGWPGVFWYATDATWMRTDSSIYTAAGTIATDGVMSVKKGGGITSGYDFNVLGESLFEGSGKVQTQGTSSGFYFKDRSSANMYAWYSTSGYAYLWYSATATNIVRVDTVGVITAQDFQLA